MTITVKIDASQKSETSIFAIPIKQEIEVKDLNEISDFIMNSGYNFSSFTLQSGEVELAPVGKLENLEGQFVTDDGKNFYIVRKMIYGRKLKEYNSESRSFDKEKGLAAQLSRGGIIRISELQRAKNLTNKPIELKIQQPNEETVEDFRTLNEIEKNRHKSCSCTGHRPDKLGGYEMKNPTMLKLKNKLLEKLERLIVDEGVDTFYSGGALGGDAAFFWCVHILKKKHPHIKNILAIPFKNQHIRWSKEQQEWYKKMLHHADEVINVELLKEYTTNQHLLLETDTNYVKLGSFSGLKMQRRNEFMIDYTGRTVCIWNGERKAKSGTWNTVRYALTETDNILIQLNPERDFEDSIVER